MNAMKNSKDILNNAIEEVSEKELFTNILFTDGRAISF